jgi:outer membrane protein assembly factor BamA
MPQNERAVAYYQHAIETWLRQKNRQDQIVMKDESDLSRGTMAVVFVPASLPKIGEVVFAGNEALDNATLQRALVKVAPGQDYTDRLFRRMLELNLRPLYDEKGRLTMSFTHIAIADPTAATSTINVEINEGPAWTLGKVELAGDRLPVDEMKKATQFPEGKLANWKQIQACIGKMEVLLRRDGYLNVTSKPDRSFHEKENTVDLTIQVRKGLQFLFAGLQINGFSPELEQKARKLWKLAEGAPMDAAYATEYVHSMLDSLRVQVKSISSSLHVRPGTNLVDVVLSFQ